MKAATKAKPCPIRGIHIHGYWLGRYELHQGPKVLREFVRWFEVKR